MNVKAWYDDLRVGSVKKPLPILSYPCVNLLGITVGELLGSGETLARGMKAVADRVDSAASVGMMDLSVEAEAFGSPVRFTDNEVPTVTGHIIKNEEDARGLRVPEVGQGRTGRYIDAVKQAVTLITDRPVLAGVIGPFSLAGRLMDVTEIMVSCYTEPETVHLTLKKTAEFLISYCIAYKEAGAHGVIMAEPLTGMLSPDLAAAFSEPYVRSVIETVQDDDFVVIYHNCGNNTILMIDSILRTGAAGYHFGNAISMGEMLAHIPSGTLVMGNIDPTGQFLNGTPESIRETALSLMSECCRHPGFVLSSGCDIPPASSWMNIDAFFAAAREFHAKCGTT